MRANTRNSFSLTHVCQRTHDAHPYAILSLRYTHVHMRFFLSDAHTSAYNSLSLICTRDSLCQTRAHAIFSYKRSRTHNSFSQAHTHTRHSLCKTRTCVILSLGSAHLQISLPDTRAIFFPRRAHTQFASSLTRIHALALDHRRDLKLRVDC